jgi:vacuolar-type H+-ATPase subunit I/STV1
MQFLNKLIQHVALTEATSADALCSDAAKISALAQAAAKYLKREGDKDISKMPMALVAGQVRSSVDASLLVDKVKLGKDALDKVVTCVMKDIQQNAKSYKLVEAEQKPRYYVTQTKADGWVVVSLATDEIVKWADSSDHAHQLEAELMAGTIQESAKPADQVLISAIGQKVSEGANPLEDLKDELEALKAELAEESDAKKRNLIRNQIAQLRTDIAKGKRSVAEGYNAVPLDTILTKFAKEYAAFKAGGDLDPGSDFYDALYDFYDDQMPYGVQKARDGDPVEWISDKLADE